MKGIRYAEGMNIMPLLAPQDIAATATVSAHVHLDVVNWVTFVVPFGAITSTDSTGAVIVTVHCSTAATTASATALAFSYRLSGAAGANTMGAITAATSAGASVGQGDDNKILVIDVDPAAIPAAEAENNQYLFLKFTPTTETTVTLLSAVAVCEARYPQNSPVVST